MKDTTKKNGAFEQGHRQDRCLTSLEPEIHHTGTHTFLFDYPFYNLWQIREKGNNKGY